MTDALSLMPPPYKYARVSQSMRELWQRPEYRQNQVESLKSSLASWHMEMMCSLAKTPQANTKRARSIAKSWQDPAVREKRISYWTPERRKERSEKFKLQRRNP